jgi:hypothetical protein
MKKKFVDNDVFVYEVHLKWDLRCLNVPVYTKPFPTRQTQQECVKDEETVEKAYFTKERIEKLKREITRRIENSENPFNIECIDRDGGYNVTEDMLFAIDEKSPSV